MRLFDFFLLLSIPCLIFSSCNKRVKPTPDPVKQYAAERFGNGFVFDYNSTGEYVILSKSFKNKPSDIFPTLRFELVQVKDMEVIFNDNLRGGKVRWIRDYIIEAESLKGIPGPEGQKPRENVYRYNVQKRKKFTGGFF